MKKCISIFLMVMLVTFTVSAQKQRGTSRSKASHKVERTKTQNSSQKDLAVNRGGNAIKEQKRSLVQQAVDDMVFVEGGTLTLGNTFVDKMIINHVADLPHQVTVSSFYISKYEVTQALWLAVMGSNPSCYTGDLNRPVEKVSWEDCQVFISRLNQLTGKHFRLPTEAEWEFAARGGNNTHGYKYAGSDNIDEVAWYRENSRDSKRNLTTFPVGMKVPNELGLYDMPGNVREWCYDFDWSYDFPAGPLVNPTGPETGRNHVYRGGSFIDNYGACMVYYRYSNYPSFSNTFLGLRLAL